MLPRRTDNAGLDHWPARNVARISGSISAEALEVVQLCIICVLALMFEKAWRSDI